MLSICSVLPFYFSICSNKAGLSSLTKYLFTSSLLCSFGLQLIETATNGDRGGRTNPMPRYIVHSVFTWFFQWLLHGFKYRNDNRGGGGGKGSILWDEFSERRKIAMYYRSTRPWRMIFYLISTYSTQKFAQSRTSTFSLLFSSIIIFLSYSTLQIYLATLTREAFFVP